MSNKMAEMWDSLGSLEDRLQSIENRIYHENSSHSKQEKNTTEILDVVVEAQRRLKDAEAKTSILGTIFKQLKELDGCLSAEFFQKVNFTTDENADLILFAKEKIQASSKKLEQINERKCILNESEIYDVPKWNKEIQPLVQVQIQQNAAVEETSSKITKLTSAYNNVISSVSKQFVQWENLITQCEIALHAAQATDEL